MEQGKFRLDEPSENIIEKIKGGSYFVDPNKACVISHWSFQVTDDMKPIGNITDMRHIQKKDLNKERESEIKTLEEFLVKHIDRLTKNPGQFNSVYDERRFCDEIKSRIYWLKKFTDNPPTLTAEEFKQKEKIMNEEIEANIKALQAIKHMTEEVELNLGAKFKPNGTDYQHSGPVFKDETTKDLLAQLKDAKTAFYLTVGMFICSFMLNVAFAYHEWNRKETVEYPLSAKEIQKRMKANSLVGADTIFTNNKKQ